MRGVSADNRDASARVPNRHSGAPNPEDLTVLLSAHFWSPSEDTNVLVVMQSQVWATVDALAVASENATG